MLGADRELALLHVERGVRPALEALFTLDSAMGDVVAKASEPMLARIKLAWWRERLEALDSGEVPAEPRLIDAAHLILPAGIEGADLAGLEAGWATLLDERVDAAVVAERGARLFAVAARLIGGTDARIEDAGRLYALASVARRGVPSLFDAARTEARGLRGHRFARSVRPLSGLARIAQRDLRGGEVEAEGSAARAFAMLRHRWSGLLDAG